MSQYDRPPKRKPQRPDDFISLMDHIVRYFEAHQNKFYILIVAVIVAFSGYGIYQYILGKKLNTIAVDYTRAEAVTGDAGFTLWEDLLKKNPPGSLKNLVAIQIANIQAQGKKWPEAADSFALSSQSVSKILKSVGDLATAISLENAKLCDRALPIYERLSKMEGDPLRWEGNLGQARCLIETGKSDEAQVVLLQLIANNSSATPAVKSAALTKLEVMKLQAAEKAPASATQESN